MVFRRETLRNTKTFKQTQPQGQANLDFSEKTITNQHDPINSGQGGGELFPSAFAQTPTNANGSDANLDFDPKTISNSTTYPMNMNSTGTNSTNPFPENYTLQHTPDSQTTPEITDNPNITEGNQPVEGVQYGGGMGFEETSKVYNHNNTATPVTARTKNIISSTQMSQEEYDKAIKNQKQANMPNSPSITAQNWDVASLTPVPIPKAFELNSADFFSGVKSGNKVTSTIPNPFSNSMTREERKSSITTNSYLDVDPFTADNNDYGNISMGVLDQPSSNQKKNKKALKDQFDLYSSFTNF
mgnify:CR=1 FL=1